MINLHLKAIHYVEKEQKVREMTAVLNRKEDVVGEGRCGENLQITLSNTTAVSLVIVYDHCALPAVDCVGKYRDTSTLPILAGLHSDDCLL